MIDNVVAVIRYAATLYIKHRQPSPVQHGPCLPALLIYARISPSNYILIDVCPPSGWRLLFTTRYHVICTPLIRAFRALFSCSIVPVSFPQSDLDLSKIGSTSCPSVVKELTPTTWGVMYDLWRFIPASFSGETICAFASITRV